METPPPTWRACQRNKLLWVMNVAWVGGTGLWCLEQIKAMSLWHHHVVYLNDCPDFSVIDQFQQAGAEISFVPSLTPDILGAINPSAVILSNTGPNKIAGGHPWKWITRDYYVVYVHHSTVRPYLPFSEIDVFVSEYLKSQYANLHDRMKRILITPPVSDMEAFFAIDRIESNRCVIGRVTNDNKIKYPKELKAILDEVGQPTFIVGAQKYWGAPPEGSTYPAINSQSVPNFLREMDVFVYRTNLSETWGRTVTEAMASGIPVVVENKGGVAEQVRNGIDGFVCATDEEFVEKLKLLVSDSRLRFRMGKHARERAAGFVKQNFKEQVEPYLLKNALKGS